jgi:pantoate--beta-alanine ligase
MRILRSIADVRAWRAEVRARDDGGRRVGFVPTMGFLHEGHLALVRAARERIGEDEGEVLLSIFVNPTQFAAGEDLDHYPRDEAGDLSKAAKAGATVAYCPDAAGAAELYSPGPPVWVHVEGVEHVLCGESRPSHFRGVCTVVTKLWNLIEPDLSVFGFKDFQQFAILERMHRELMFTGEVLGVATVREPDGLAMSSRNANLSPEERAAALALPNFLRDVRRRFIGGERGAEALLSGGPERLATVGAVDYVTCVDAESLMPVDAVQRAAIVAVAVRFARARLIDHTVLDPADPHTDPHGLTLG